MTPRLAVSMGDPVGIGPEVIVGAISEGVDARLTVFGDPDVLRKTVTLLDASIEVREVQADTATEVAKGVLNVVPVSRIGAHDWGQTTPASDGAQLQYILQAVEAVQAGAFDGIVTAPISKAAIRRAGAKWPGHTEMLAYLTKGDGDARRPVMMLAGPTLRTVPLTTHVGLRDVSSKLSSEKIVYAVEVVDDALRRFFGHETPKIAVAGLNPHAGEGGLFGDEEARIIAPALETLQGREIAAVGPMSADTVFLQAARGDFDAVIGMYHDQALIPVKLLDFDHAVNVTLGLSIIRTSVDHGTAYDIAGRGEASSTSMTAAMQLAAEMVRRSKGAIGARKDITGGDRGGGDAADAAHRTAERRGG